MCDALTLNPEHCSDVEGLVGPLVDSGVLLVEALPECVADACDVDAREDMIQFVRQVMAALFHVSASASHCSSITARRPSRGV